MHDWLAVADYRRIVSPAQKSFSEVYGKFQRCPHFLSPCLSHPLLYPGSSGWAGFSHVICSMIVYIHHVDCLQSYLSFLC